MDSKGANDIGVGGSEEGAIFGLEAGQRVDCVGSSARCNTETADNIAPRSLEVVGERGPRLAPLIEEVKLRAPAIRDAGLSARNGHRADRSIGIALVFRARRQARAEPERIEHGEASAQRSISRKKTERNRAPGSEQISLSKADAGRFCAGVDVGPGSPRVSRNYVEHERLTRITGTLSRFDAGRFKEWKLPQPPQGFRHAQCVHGIALGEQELSANYVRSGADMHLPDESREPAKFGAGRLYVNRINPKPRKRAKGHFRSDS